MATSAQRGYEKGDLAARAAGAALGAGLAFAPRAVPFVKQRWYLVVPAIFWAPVPLFLLVGILFGDGDTLALAFKAAFVAGLVTWGCLFIRKQTSTVPRPVLPADPFDALRRHWPEVARHARLFGVPTPDGRVVPALARQFGYLPPVAEQAPSLVQIEATLLGPALTVRMHPGQVLKDYQRAAEVIANLWQVPNVRVAQPTGTDTVVITLVTSDPLAQGFEVTPETVPPMASLDSVEIGRLEDGSPWNFKIDSTSSVIGGVPGGGKSVALSGILVGLAQRPDVAIVGIDCKEMMEFSSMADRFSASAGNQEEALEILRELEQIRVSRGEMLRLSNFSSLKRMGYTPDYPLICVALDECAELFSAETSTKEARERASELIGLVSRLVRLGRAMGIVVLAATQRPTVDVLPGGIRDNCSQKVAFRCTTGDQAKAILGDVPEISPVQISHSQKGYAVVAEDDKGASFARAYFVSEETKREVAHRTAHLAIPLTRLK